MDNIDGISIKEEGWLES